jgi:WD40 repeat protein
VTKTIFDHWGLPLEHNPYLLPFGPEQSAPPHSRGYAKPKKVALAAKCAIFSLVLGIISLLDFFLGVTIVLAIVAIVLGHLALSQIKNSAGALKGIGIARMGLITGYFGLVLSSISIFLFFYLSADRNQRKQIALARANEPIADIRGATSEATLTNVEHRLMHPGRHDVFGNNEDGSSRAIRFNMVMRHLENLIGEKDPVLKKIEAFSYTTHCEMHPDRAAFTVQVGGSAGASAQTMQLLQELSWVTASVGLQELLKPRQHLAVYLRDSDDIISIQYGKVGSEDPLYQIDRNSFARFFASFDGKLPTMSDRELPRVPNRSLANRPGPPGRNPPAVNEEELLRDLLVSSENDLSERLRTAPPSGLRQNAPALPRIGREPLKLDAEEYATLILDTKYSPSSSLKRKPNITAVRFSPDGKQLAVGLLEGSIYLYQLNGHDLYRLPVADHANVGVSGLNFSADGKKLYVGSEDGSLFYYTLSHPPTNSRCTELTKQAKAPRLLCLSADEQTIYSADGFYLSQQPALSRGGIRKSEMMNLPLEYVSLDKDGSGVLYSDGKKLMRLDLQTNQSEGLDDWVLSIDDPWDISPQTQKFANSYMWDVSLNLYGKANKMMNLSRPKNDIKVPSQPDDLKFTPLGDRLVVGGFDTVSILDIGRSRRIADFSFNSNTSIVVRDISADGQFAMVQPRLQESILYVLPLPGGDNLPPGSPRDRPGSPEAIAKTVPLPAGFQPTAGLDGVANARPPIDGPQPSDLPKGFTHTPPSVRHPFDPNRNPYPKPRIALPEDPNAAPTVKLLPIADHKIAVFNNLPRGADPIAFSPSGQQLMVAKKDDTLLQLDLDTKIGRPIKVDKLGDVSAITYSRDGKTVFAGTNKGQICALEIDDAGKLLSKRHYQGHRGQVTSLLGGINGKFIVSAGRDYRIVWQQLTTKGVIREIKQIGASISQLYEIPGEPVLLASTRSQVIRVNMRTSAIEPENFKNASISLTGQVSPDGKLIATTLGDQITIHDRLEGTPLATVKAGLRQRNLIYTPDNKYVLLYGGDTISIFNPREPQSIINFTVPGSDEVRQLTISPDSKRFAMYTTTLGETLYVMPLTDLETLK